MNYVTSKEIKQQLQISGVTLMQWKNSGKIQYKKLSDKKILYDLDSLNTTTENSNNLNTKNVIYARVSSRGQKDDLNNQIEIIKNYMLNNGIKVDIRGEIDDKSGYSLNNVYYTRNTIF